MKALSLWQPWASLMAFGEKRIETRSWSTGYLGPLAIAATARTPAWYSEWRPIDVALRRHGLLLPLPTAAVLCVVKLVDCVPVEKIRDSLSADELAFGDYSNGRYAWITTDCRRLAKPIPCKGKQGLWNFTERI